MRKKNILIFRKTVFYSICAVITLYSCHQSNEKNEESSASPSTIRPIPFMWIPKEKAVERSLWFRFGRLPTCTASKEDLLTNYLGTTHTLGYAYPSTLFDTLLDEMEAQNPTMVGLRVYFGAYDPTCMPDGGVPMKNITENQIVLIFAPTDGSTKHNDLGKYYIFGSDGNPYPFARKRSPDVKADWLDNYQSNEAESQDVLAVTLEQGASENQDNVTGQTTDTKSILYCYKDFKDFIQTERNYQVEITKTTAKPQGIPIDTIEIDFASFPDTGIGSNRYPLPITNASFKNRLHVLFGFKRNGAAFYIDDSPDFYIRHSQAGQDTSACPGFYQEALPKRWVLGGGGSGDNGQLCPPYNCP